MYFENGKRFPEPKETKALVGKNIKYLQKRDIDHTGRGLFFPQYGTVEEVHGKNIMISGSWYWIPDFVEYEE